jgi:tetratricopeptide (TPR) repeat protein
MYGMTTAPHSLALNRGSEAIACFDQAISIKLGDSSAWNNKGFAHFFLGQYGAALPGLGDAQNLGATRSGGMIAVCFDKLEKW